MNDTIRWIGLILAWMTSLAFLMCWLWARKEIAAYVSFMASLFRMNSALLEDVSKRRYCPIHNVPMNLDTNNPVHFPGVTERWICTVEDCNAIMILHFGSRHVDAISTKPKSDTVENSNG